MGSKVSGATPKVQASSNNHPTNAIGIDRLHGSQQPNSQEHVRHASPFIQRSNVNMFYKMDNPHRGLAIIFNHYKYKADRENPREGTHHDKERLAETFHMLNFEVHKHQDDLTFDQILLALEKVQRENHADKDCLVVTVLTHGSWNGCLSAFDKDYSFSALWKPFTDINCPSLKGKPRLFFVQACRGNQLMDPVELVRTETDANPYSTPIPDIPNHFLVAYSTCEGYFSWRDINAGSWFIQTLCQQLKDNAYKYDLNHILTQVLRRVAIEKESVVPYDLEHHEKKQMPCVVTKLHRLLLFKENPKK